ncbi:MAG: LptF/LptG family permease [Bacteroidaceae bacterium]|nr:LptF/LptG family permease [Bacteroidaceae bacterium]
MRFLDYFKIKKLDLFIIKTFATNLLGTFFICLFIFIMQLLWRWVDDFVDKGLDFSILAQFFSLSAITLVAQALPLAILLASLMTFGNFGEKLELLAMKAAGIPLFRIMRPLIICCTILGIVSFYFQNVVSPYAQMKLYAIMYSIKQSSPESEIPEKIFYDRLEGYNIYVEKKDKETGVLYDIIIYDISGGFENANIVLADSATITSTADEKYMILSMYSGEQFSNLQEQNIQKKNVPYRRETFRKKDLLIESEGGFELKDASIMKSNADSKNIKELEISIDTLSQESDSIANNHWINLKRTTYKADTKLDNNDSVKMDTYRIYSINADSVYNVATKKSKLIWKRTQLNKVKQLKVDYEIKHNIMHSREKDLNKHKIAWWSKFTLSFGCIVFFFIGAPLGAIVRKGGLGYPVLISVATFILYYIFNTSGYKMAREGEWHVWLGSWLSTIVLAPLGAFFTYHSNKDSEIFNSDSINRFFRMLFAIPEKRAVTLKEVVIDDPNYAKAVDVLTELHNGARAYKKKNRLKKLPSIKSVFFNEKDHTIDDFNEKMEALIEELGNSKTKKVIIMLNTFPVLSTHAITSPFKKRWLNVLSVIIFPLGILIYLRAIKFRRRLVKDLVKIEKNSKKTIEVIHKEKLA